MVQDETRARVFSKVTWHILPFVMILYFIAYLDRVNVGFAALTMNADIGLSATAYGLGAGIFFIGYLVFEVPSNLLLQKFGARVWIARIMFTWGIISCGMAFVTGEKSFYVLRFLLGVAEAGFFPGMIFYLTNWFPSVQRAKIVGAFLIAVPLSSVIGAPISTALLGIEGFGLAGWQWLFLIEGAPAVLLSFAVLAYLTDDPAKAKWLTEDEKNIVTQTLAEDRKANPIVQSHTFGEAMLNGRVWLFGTVYFGITFGIYGLSFWLPQIVKGFGDLTNTEIGFITAVPYIFASAAMYVTGRHSDATGERILHVMVPALLGAAGFVVAAFAGNSPALALAGITVGSIGIYAAIPAFWTLPTAMLTGTAAAAGIALVNSLGNTGGYFGPFILGYFRELDNSYQTGLLFLAGFLSLTGILVALVARGMRRKTA